MTSDGFVVTGCGRKREYLLCGRARIEDSDLAIHIDEKGRYTADPAHVRIVLLLGGYCPVRCPDGTEITGEKRDGGRGLWITIDRDRFVIPGRSLHPVLEGRAKKAGVFRWEGSEIRG